MPRSSFVRGASSPFGGRQEPGDMRSSREPRDSGGSRRRQLKAPSSFPYLLAACLLPAGARAFVPPMPYGRHFVPGVSTRSLSVTLLPLPAGCCSRCCCCGDGGCRTSARGSELSMLSLPSPLTTAATAVATAASTALPFLRRPTGWRSGETPGSSVSNGSRGPFAHRDANADAVAVAAAAAAAARGNSKSGDAPQLPRQIVTGARKRIGALFRRSASKAAAAVVRGAKSYSPTRPRVRISAGIGILSAVTFMMWTGRGAAVAAMITSSGASGASASGAQKITLESVAPKLGLWFVLFVTSAAFHSAEIAITTLYPWKVKEFAEEEGENSPFQVLNKDITRVLTTILVTTTVCTIYNAALFTNLAIQLFGSAGLAYATAALTVTTLFFGELLPKALGVNNAEVVARRVLPTIILLSVVLSPIAKTFTLISKLMLSMFGFKSTESDGVSEEELRLIVTGAKMSGGIESQEGRMIEGVLDLQDTKISEIMRPRVEVVAIEGNSTMMDLYQLHQETKYSRIPVYSGEIDRILGVVLSKDLLEFVQEPEKLSSVLVADETESTYFVPETMSVWNVLEEMRKRRLHMAVVVDEYGGTAGVVTLEDILEEVVGEIYDETEDDELREEEHYINLNEDGSFTIHGMADLEDVCTSLAVKEVSEDDLKEFGTLSGYLCSQAGEIPAVGDYVMVGSYMFTVTKADERRIEEVHAKLLVAQEGSADESNSGRVHAGSGAGGQIENGGSKKAAEGTIVSGDRLPPASPGA